MSTMNISLPLALKSFVDEQVNQRGYGTSSEYVRELIRKDQDRLQLRALLLAGAASAPPPRGCPLLRRAAGSGAQGSQTRSQGVKTKPVIPREQAGIEELQPGRFHHALPAVACPHIDPPEQVRQRM